MSMVIFKWQDTVTFCQLSLQQLNQRHEQHFVWSSSLGICGKCFTITNSSFSLGPYSGENDNLETSKNLQTYNTRLLLLKCIKYCIETKTNYLRMYCTAKWNIKGPLSYLPRVHNIQVAKKVIQVPLHCHLCLIWYGLLPSKSRPNNRQSSTRWNISEPKKKKKHV